jgi:hypothetical protein
MAYYDFVVFAHQSNTLRQIRAYSALIRGFARVVPFAWRDPLPRSVGGHYSHTRSVVVGLEQLGVNFAYQPRLDRTEARAALVLLGIDELKAAIEWRRRGGCKLLLAGPTVVERPHDKDGILLSPEIDRVVVASDKVRLQYESLAPQLIGRILVCPSGVDENYWRASPRRPQNRVLIYNKRMPQVASQLVSVLSKNGFPCEVINYGERRKDRYRFHQYRSALNRAFVCIMLTLDEPSGNMATECWSMDVPTMAYRAPGYENAATLPFVNSATGSYWSSIDELLGLLRGLSYANYQPRNWVLTNMTDAICSANLINLVNKIEVDGLTRETSDGGESRSIAVEKA